ncbi:MAG TPA: hypothetical protein VLD39_16280, partial [Gammaproteobacteria bacterium]|nr:hypothetical protein [Gammaproteobacteria bacterium]
GELGELEVPDSLAALLNARLDALSESSKRVAQTAAVIGRSFDFDIIASVFEPLDILEGALKDLQRRGLVREKSRRPVHEFVFKHMLTRDAAYESLLLRDRRTMHAAVAEALVRLTPDRVSEIASHFVAARENGKALPWLVDAGDIAARAHATEEAIQAYGKAIEIVESGVDDIALARRAFEGRGNMLQMTGRMDEAIANYESMKHYAADRGGGSMQVSAMNKIGLARTFMGQLELAENWLDEADEKAHAVQCSAGLAESSMYRCFIYTAQGQFQDANDALERAAELGQQLQAEEPRLFGLAHIANTLIEMTEFEAARDAIATALDEAERYGNKRWLAELLTFPKPTLQMRDGDFAGMIETVTQGLELARSIGHPFARANGALNLGAVAGLQGRFEEAIALNEEALEAANRTGFAMMQSMALC